MNVVLKPRYSIDLQQIPERIRTCFFEMHEDDATRAFYSSCERVRFRFLKGFFQDLVSIVVGVYRADAWFQKPHVHLLGRDAWKTFLNGRNMGSALDVGVGLGYISKAFMPHVTRYEGTETSPYLAAFLQKKGMHVLHKDITHATDMYAQFDTVLLCNVLDRCKQPITLLKNAARCLTPDGALIIATPLPMCGYVRVGASIAEQSEHITQNESLSWEESVAGLVSIIEKETGLLLHRATRVPYGVETYVHPGYSLHDNAVLMFSTK